MKFYDFIFIAIKPYKTDFRGAVRTPRSTKLRSYMHDHELLPIYNLIAI